MTTQRLWPFFRSRNAGLFGAGEEPQYEPVWLRCLEAVVASLQGLAGSGELESIAEESIVAAEQPDASMLFGSEAKALGLAYPGIIVWPYQQEGYAPSEGTNERDEVIYPVAVSFVDTGSGVTGTNAMIVNRAAYRRHMLWREKVSRKFRKGTWPEITEIRESDVRYQLYALPSEYRSNDIFHGAIVIDFKAWETRDG